MKYGESTFDILYLLFAIAAGVFMLLRSRSKTGRMMGLAALILGSGDAFHLVPRVINYFSSSDMTAALGIGKLVTSVTMTFFYVLMYYIWTDVFSREKTRRAAVTVWSLTALRVILCLLPGNDWINNGNSMTWGIIRNIPFVILGAYICYLWFKTRTGDKVLRPMWILIALSFAFYIPVAVFAWILPILGMLMLPKTICYIIMIILFLRKALKRE